MLRFRPPKLILPPRPRDGEDPPPDEELPPLFEEEVPFIIESEFQQADYPYFSLTPLPFARPGEYRRVDGGS
jgi:hypothetical protein